MFDPPWRCTRDAAKGNPSHDVERHWAAKVRAPATTTGRDLQEPLQGRGYRLCVPTSPKGYRLCVRWVPFMCGKLSFSAGPCHVSGASERGEDKASREFHRGLGRCGHWVQDEDLTDRAEGLAFEVLPFAVVRPHLSS